jgi:hypothetical protein
MKRGIPANGPDFFFSALWAIITKVNTTLHKYPTGVKTVIENRVVPHWNIAEFG